MNGMSIHYAKYLVRSMMGLLYYAKYKESNKTNVLLERIESSKISIEACHYC
jgi:hypothetical protein